VLHKRGVNKMNIEDTKKAMLAELSKYTEIPKDKEEDVLNFLFSAFFQVEVEDLQEVVEDLEAKRLEEFDRDTDEAIRDRLETEGVV
jgi:histone deacetylase complex regulatory component SIN3|tara:strand:+ start:25 stop:285 length:261 start_codon:yes stop_codon:yes gene_type:complete